MDTAPSLQDRIRPPYYTRFRIEPLAFIAMNHLDFLQGNIIKYICRYEGKNGVEDLMKARRYLDELINRTQTEEGRNAAPTR